MIGIDLFAGAGGLSLGAEWAGINVVAAIEMEKNAAATYKRNHKGTIVINDDIHHVDAKSLPQDIKEPLVVFGGPPCQGFSTSNTRTRTMKNPNNSLFEEFVRFVDELHPEWFVFENVEGFVLFGNGDVRMKVRSCFEELGYEINDRVLLASRYGVPQNRNRFFMVGNKKGVSFEFPEGSDDVVTVSQAIDDLPDLVNGQPSDSLPYKYNVRTASIYAKEMRKGSKCSRQNYVSRNEDYVIERYSYIKQGQNWRAIPDELMKNYANKQNCHSGIYKRLVADKPSVVISNYRKNMLIHPYQDRGLSVREAARLQSFPDTYVFEGSLMHQQQQIGNAVPPLLAKSIFLEILKQSNTIKKSNET